VLERLVNGTLVQVGDVWQRDVSTFSLCIRLAIGDSNLKAND